MEEEEPVAGETAGPVRVSREAQEVAGWAAVAMAREAAVTVMAAQAASMVVEGMEAADVVVVGTVVVEKAVGEAEEAVLEAMGKEEAAKAAEGWAVGQDLAERVDGWEAPMEATELEAKVRVVVERVRAEVVRAAEVRAAAAAEKELAAAATVLAVVVMETEEAPMAAPAAAEEVTGRMSAPAPAAPSQNSSLDRSGLGSTSGLRAAP